MAYSYDLSDRSLARGSRRIALELARRALAHIETPSLPQAEAVHEIRKSVKKLRALLRLIRPGLTDHAGLDATLRDAARQVSALRDATVLLHTLEALAPGGLPTLRAALEAAPQRAPETAAAALAACRADLARAEQALSDLDLAGHDTTVLEAGLGRSLRQAQAALHQVLHAPADGAEALHEFRKRVKDHLYHSRLLTPLWPALLAPHAEAAETLAEALGLINDIAVFTAALAPLDLPEAERVEALARAAVRHDQLMLTALPLAARLFAGRPADLAERWSALWSIWRAEAG